ncbi:hypothetical protein OROGR_006360 [Orobanche gracilis]
MISSFITSIFDGNYYQPDRQIFLFGTHALGITLEDVLYITGLPIKGEPVLYKEAFDDGAFNRIFGRGRFLKKTTLPVKEIKKIALDKKKVEEYGPQKIANLDKIDDYSWGATLLAYLYNGMRRYKYISGNLWVLLVFFIIRIKKLQTALGIKLKYPPKSVKQGEQWLSWIVREINKKTHDHYAKWTIDSMLPITEKDIIWRPYEGKECPLPGDRNSVRDLVPLFCYYVVVHHKPHHCSRQYRVFNSYDLIPNWDDYEIEIKERKGGGRITFLCTIKRLLLGGLGSRQRNLCNISDRDDDRDEEEENDEEEQEDREDESDGEEEDREEEDREEEREEDWDRDGNWVEQEDREEEREEDRENDREENRREDREEERDDRENDREEREERENDRKEEREEEERHEPSLSNC